MCVNSVVLIRFTIVFVILLLLQCIVVRLLANNLVSYDRISEHRLGHTSAHSPAFSNHVKIFVSRNYCATFTTRQVR